MRRRGQGKAMLVDGVNFGSEWRVVGAIGPTTRQCDGLHTLTYETGDRVARITLNRPDRGNGITPRMPVELADCVERANLDPVVHVIALAGNGSGFCGGYDLVASAEGDMSELGGVEARRGRRSIPR